MHKNVIYYFFSRQIYGRQIDLIIYEPGYVTTLLAFGERIINPPTIALWTGHRISPIDRIFGNPIIPSYITSPVLPFGDRMTFWERLVNAFFELYFDYMIEYKVRPINEKYKELLFGGYVFSKLRDIEYNTSLHIITTDFLTGYPRPVHPNTIYVGPLHIGLPQEPLESVSSNYSPFSECWE